MKWEARGDLSMHRLDGDENDGDYKRAALLVVDNTGAFRGIPC